MIQNKWTQENIKNKDYFNLRRIAAAEKLHFNYIMDPDHDVRISRRECIVCYYNSRICGQAFTIYICNNCGDEYQHSNTCAPALCANCSLTLNVCYNCGGNL